MFYHKPILPLSQPECYHPPVTPFIHKNLLLHLKTLTLRHVQHHHHHYTTNPYQLVPIWMNLCNLIAMILWGLQYDNLAMFLYLYVTKISICTKIQNIYIYIHSFFFFFVFFFPIKGKVMLHDALFTFVLIFARMLGGCCACPARAVFCSPSISAE